MGLVTVILWLTIDYTYILPLALLFPLPMLTADTDNSKIDDNTDMLLHIITYCSVSVFTFTFRSFYFARNSIKVCCSFSLVPVTIGVRCSTESSLYICIWLMVFIWYFETLAMLPEYFSFIFLRRFWIPNYLHEIN